MLQARKEHYDILRKNKSEERKKQLKQVTLLTRYIKSTEIIVRQAGAELD